MAVDAEGAVRDWINSLTATLVGVGNPLQLGAYLGHLRSPAKGAYALLLRVGGTGSLIAERPVDRAVVSASIYGLTKHSAALAACAYHDALTALDGLPTPMGESAVCVAVDSITGPVGFDRAHLNEPEWRYLVDCAFHLVPVSAL